MSTPVINPVQGSGDTPFSLRRIDITAPALGAAVAIAMRRFIAEMMKMLQAYNEVMGKCNSFKIQMGQSLNDANIQLGKDNSDKAQYQAMAAGVQALSSATTMIAPMIMSWKSGALNDAQSGLTRAQAGLTQLDALDKSQPNGPKDNAAARAAAGNEQAEVGLVVGERQNSMGSYLEDGFRISGDKRPEGTALTKKPTAKLKGEDGALETKEGEVLPFDQEALEGASLEDRQKARAKLQKEEKFWQNKLLTAQNNFRRQTDMLQNSSQMAQAGTTAYTSYLQMAKETDIGLQQGLIAQLQQSSGITPSDQAQQNFANAASTIQELQRNAEQAAQSDSATFRG